MPSKPAGRSQLGRPARFFLLLALCLLTGFGLVLTPPAQDLTTRFSLSLVSLSHSLIAPFDAHAHHNGAILINPATGFGVEMKDGCNAVNVTILFWAAVLAYPASWRWKAFGLVLGTLLIQALNVVRFISLFYIGQYSATWFDFAHGYLWETLIVLDSLVLFWLWVHRASPPLPSTHAPA